MNKDQNTTDNDKAALAPGERGITIRGDATHAIIISGDNNQVTQLLTSEQAQELLEILRKLEHPETWDGRAPYVGLAPFAEEDTEFFFGREKLVTELMERIQQANFLCIAGPSGSGKSSLVHAGLIPALKQGRFEGSTRWLFISFSPHDDPIQHLAQAMARLTKSPVAAEYIQKHGLTQPDALHKQVETLLTDVRQQRCIIVVDQFEELFTQTQDEAQRLAFVNLLTTAVTLQNTRITVVLTLRADFLSPCANYPDLRALLNQPQQFRLVGAMAPEELLQAIVMPVLTVGASIEPPLVAQIITDMKGEPGVLPLMQFALQELFTQASPHKGHKVVLTLDAYIQNGGVYGVLEQHADKVLNRLDKERLPIARHIFTQLVKVSRDAVATKRAVSLRELVAAKTSIKTVEAVVSHFADDNARLITTGIAEPEYAPMQPESSYQPLNPPTVNWVSEQWLTVQFWLKKLVLAIRARFGDAATKQPEIDTERPEPSSATVKWQNISLAHEKLIDAWSWLKELVDENREAQLFQQRLDEMRRAWEKNGRDTDGLLRGAQLTEALVWAGKYPHPLLAEFLTRSRRHEQWGKWRSVGGRSVIGLLLIPGLFFGVNAWMFWQRQHSSWQPIASFPSQVVTAVAIADEMTDDSYPPICVGTNHIGIGCTHDGVSWNLYQSGMPTGVPDWFNSRDRLWGALLGSEWSGRGRAIFALAFDQADSSRIIAFFRNEGLYFSHDAGVHWTPFLPKPTMPGFPQSRAGKIYVQGNYLLIASGFDAPGEEQGRLFVSNDDGQLWQEIKSMTQKTRKINDFAVSKATDSGTFELFFVAEHGLFHTNLRNLQNVEQVLGVPEHRELIWITDDPAREVFYLTGYDAQNNWSYLYRWRRGEREMEQWGAGHERAIRTLVVNPNQRAPDILWLLFESGEVFSVDAGGALTPQGKRPGWFWAQTWTLWFAPARPGKAGEYIPYLGHSDGVLQCADCLSKNQ